MAKTKMTMKKADSEKDKEVRGILGYRYRFSGANLRRIKVLLIGGQVLENLSPDSPRRGSNKQWIDRTEDKEILYRTIEQGLAQLKKEAAVLYGLNESGRVTKVLRKNTVDGVRYYDSKGQSPYWMRRAAQQRKLFKDKAAVVKLGVKDLEKDAKRYYRLCLKIDLKIESLQAQASTTP